MAKSFQELKQQAQGVEKAHPKNNIDPEKDPLGFALAQAFLTTDDKKLKQDAFKWATSSPSSPM